MIRTRKATVADARAIAEVHVSSWQSAYRGILPDEFLSSLSVEDRAIQWMRILACPVPKSSHSVVQRDGSIMGLIGWGPCRDAILEREDTGEIYGIYLHEHEWGKGIGHMLIGDALRELRSSGFSEVKLWVLERNQRARLFYERLQFELESASRSVEYGGAMFALVCYRRSLSDDSIEP